MRRGRPAITAGMPVFPGGSRSSRPAFMALAYPSIPWVWTAEWGCCPNRGQASHLARRPRPEIPGLRSDRTGSPPSRLRRSGTNRPRRQGARRDQDGSDDYMPCLWSQPPGDDAGERLPALLPLSELPGGVEAKARRLLRFLLLRGHGVSAQAGRVARLGVVVSSLRCTAVRRHGPPARHFPAALSTTTRTSSMPTPCARQPRADPAPLRFQLGVGALDDVEA